MQTEASAMQNTHTKSRSADNGKWDEVAAVLLKQTDALGGGGGGDFMATVITLVFSINCKANGSVSA
jgi:hypothetical protein